MCEARLTNQPKQYNCRNFLLLIFLFNGLILNGQNLVPNPSFEIYVSLPSGYGQIQKAQPWYSVNGTPDFFHILSSGAPVPTNFFGNQMPRTGSGYAGIARKSNDQYHEFMGAPLTTPLTVGVTYYFEIYVSAGEGGYKYGTNNFGAYFSIGSLSGVPNVTPQVNYLPVILNYLGWQLVSGSFTATSPWTYITLGNFYSTGATIWTNLGTGGTISFQYWYVEDVLVQGAAILPLNLAHLKANLENETTARLEWAVDNHSDASHYLIHRSLDGGNSFEEIGRVNAECSQGMVSYTFNDQPGVSSQNVFYKIKEVEMDGSVHYSELAEVYMPFIGLQAEMKAFPNPTAKGQGMNLAFPHIPGGESATITITDLTGRTLSTQTILQSETTNLVELPVQNFDAGIYFVKVTSGMESATTTIKIG